MAIDNSAERIIADKIQNLADIDKSIALLRNIVINQNPNYDELRKAYHQLILARAILDTDVRTEASYIGLRIADDKGNLIPIYGADGPITKKAVQ